MDISMISAVFLLLVLLDPIGNIPLYLATVEQLEKKRRVPVITRECAIAYAILILFAVMGNHLMGWMHLSNHAMGIAGGVLLFIIALRMIFRRPEGVFGEASEGEPLIFPLAVPLFAGPSAIAFVLLLTSRAPDRLPEWIGAITIASAVSTLILAFSSRLNEFIGKRGIRAMETLLGLLLTAIATQMLLDGIGDYLQHLGVHISS
jgi:MarC family membrane protein